MKKDNAVAARSRWANALSAIAREAGNDSPLYKALGTVAWGRYDGEPSATDSKDNALLGLGFLQGVRYALMNAGTVGQFDTSPLRTIHDRIRMT